jgi:ELWxxDGT repeat protein
MMTSSDIAAFMSSDEADQTATGLWLTDGTAQGTVEILSDAAGTAAAWPTMFYLLNGRIYFAWSNGAASGGLWSSDGTAAGTFELPAVPQTPSSYADNTQFTAAGLDGRMVFDWVDANQHSQLWSTDGTTAGTTEITALGPGLVSADDPVSFDNKILFEGVDGSGNVGVWITDGTSQGTARLVETNYAAASYQQLIPSSAVILGDDAYFLANGNLWETDGTRNGTRDIPLGDSGATVSGLVGAGQTLFFVEQTSSGTATRTLYVSDGTAANTHAVASMPSGSNSCYTMGMLGASVLVDIDGSLWISDGTNSTELAADFNLRNGSEDAVPYVVSLGTIAVITSLNGVWATDGTSAGTHLLFANSDASAVSPDLVKIGSRAMFETTGAGGNALWLTDGTAGGTTEINTNAAVRSFGANAFDVSAVENLDGSSSPTLIAGPPPTPSPTPAPTPTPSPSSTPSSSSSSTPGLGIFDATTGQAIPGVAQAYSGPVAGLSSQYITVTPHDINIAVSTPGWFLHSGSGNDALAVSSGINVLDGGTGSNFLTGGSGADTFFIDDRGAPADIWSTLDNVHAGDAATVYGVTPDDFTVGWFDGQGAAGYAGLTLHATAPGKATASLTLVGYSTADLQNGRLSVSFGTDAAAGTTYLYIHANG